MLTIYATVDKDRCRGRCLWVRKPKQNQYGTWLCGVTSPVADSNDSSCRDASLVVSKLFPRGMKPGEIRKFQIPRLGE